MKAELKEKNWQNISVILEKMLDSAYQGFLKHRFSHLEKVRQLKKEWTAVVPIMAEHLLRQLSVGDMLEIMNHLEFIRNGIAQVVEQTETKIEEGILFSDEDVGELKEIFVGTGELLNHFRNYWMTSNPVVARRILEQIAVFSDKCNLLSSEHEECLINGLCMARSSIIYLNILAALRDMLMHMGQLLWTMIDLEYIPLDTAS